MDRVAARRREAARQRYAKNPKAHRDKSKRWYETKGQESSPGRETRYWSNVKVGAPEDCWVYSGSRIRTEHGRGPILLGETLAHRIAWRLLIPYVPIRGLELHHSCENKLCVNPAHLYPITGDEHKRIHNAKFAADRELLARLRALYPDLVRQVSAGFLPAEAKTYSR